MDEAMHLYAVALGSNRRHARHGRPAGVIEAAIARLDREFLLFDAAPILINPAMGGAGRDFANSVALVQSPLDPPAMLAALKAIERQFGRRGGRRWSARVLDLDIVAWDGGRWRSRTLSIPHPRLAERDFVVDPLAAVAPHWQIEGRTPRQLAARLRKPRPGILPPRLAVAVPAR